MKVNSYNIEFGYELLSAVPYAYELYLSNLLTETESGVDTEALYYFSPKHVINKSNRSWYNTEIARLDGLPYTNIHTSWPEQKVFPPYKTIYANEQYKFAKPTLCICNRYNKEWDLKPINYFNESMLEYLFSTLKEAYEIVYFPVSIPKEFYDGVEPLPLNDIAIAKKHGIKIFSDLCAGKSWNLTMLQVFANCEHYITMNGGYSILASMFSGTNIIYSKPGTTETREIKNKSFWRWYPNINNVRTLHVSSYDELKTKVETIYVDKLPCINILIRTHRPNYLKICMQSIERQTYGNINVVLICDSDNAIKYTTAYKARVIRVNKSQYNISEKPDSENYGMGFIFNRYLHTAQSKVSGYIMLLDDDDKLTKDTSVETIAKHVDDKSLVVWKSDLKAVGIVPSHSFGKEIILYDITGISICYPTTQIKNTDWSEWKRADFRTAKKLSSVLNIKWIDEILASIQDRAGFGCKRDLPNYNHVEIYYPNGVTRDQYYTDEEMPEIEKYFKRLNVEIKLVT